MMKYRDFVYDIVRKIPRGKVGTYGQVAGIIQKSKWTCSDSKNQNFNSKSKITSRVVGRVLHLNLHPDVVPCHRVVSSEGRVAENFAFGGWKEQKRRLQMEGVTFKDKRHADLKEHLWSGH